MTIYTKLHDAMMEHSKKYGKAPQQAFMGGLDWQALEAYWVETQRFSTFGVEHHLVPGAFTLNMPLGGVVLYRAEGLHDVVVA